MTGLRRMPTSPRGLPQTQAAIEFAQRAHAGQCRGDGSPFIRHPLEVASLLYYAGAADHLIAAGVLHDVVEKADVAGAELRGRFGARIASLVLAVSEDDRIADYGERKAALRRQVAAADENALTLFAADKLSKLRELRRETDAGAGPGVTAPPGTALHARRLSHYRRSVALLEERIPASPVVMELRDELAALLRDRAVAAAR
ncbi:MAG TPA: HD domain-containing protein [Solirubrobacteraceae bacterium]|nr:HD domain-containing protein [Solirubrobacteraceae bacterium]